MSLETSPRSSRDRLDWHIDQAERTLANRGMAPQTGRIALNARLVDATEPNAMIEAAPVADRTPAAHRESAENERGGAVVEPKTSQVPPAQPVASPREATASAAAPEAGKPALHPHPPTLRPSADDHLHWWSNPRTLLRYVLSLDDTPHRVALGTSIGMFIGLTPTVGVQMLLVIIVYYLCKPFFRFNCTAAIVTVYISNPLTMLPLYWFDYSVGRMFFGGDVTKTELSGILEYHSFSEWWATVVTLFVDLGWTMLVGSFIVGSIAAVIAYPVMRWLLKKFHQVSGITPMAD